MQIKRKVLQLSGLMEFGWGFLPAVPCERGGGVFGKRWCTSCDVIRPANFESKQEPDSVGVQTASFWPLAPSGERHRGAMADAGLIDQRLTVTRNFAAHSISDTDAFDSVLASGRLSAPDTGVSPLQSIAHDSDSCRKLDPVSSTSDKPMKLSSECGICTSVCLCPPWCLAGALGLHMRVAPNIAGDSLGSTDSADSRASQRSSSNPLLSDSCAEEGIFDGQADGTVFAASCTRPLRPRPALGGRTRLIGWAASSPLGQRQDPSDAIAPREVSDTLVEGAIPATLQPKPASGALLSSRLSLALSTDSPLVDAAEQGGGHMPSSAAVPPPPTASLGVEKRTREAELSHLPSGGDAAAQGAVVSPLESLTSSSAAAVAAAATSEPQSKRVAPYDSPSTVPELWQVPGGNPWTAEPEPSTGSIPRGARPVTCFRRPVPPRLPVGPQRFAFPVASATVNRFAALSPTLEHLPAAAPRLFPGGWTPDGTSRYAGVRRGPAAQDGRPTWWACIERLGVTRWMGPMKTEAEAARAVDTALLLTRGPEARTNFAYHKEELFADAALRDAEGSLGQLHADYYARAYRVARRWQAEDVEAELHERRALETSGRVDGGPDVRETAATHTAVDRVASGRVGPRLGSRSRPSAAPRAAASSSSVTPSVVASSSSRPPSSAVAEAPDGTMAASDPATGDYERVAKFGAPAAIRKPFIAPYKGVVMCSAQPHARWRAVWEHGAMRETLGMFPTARAAAVAHDVRALVHAQTPRRGDSASSQAGGGDVSLNFEGTAGSALPATVDMPGGDVYDATLAAAAKAQSWPVEEVLGGALMSEEDGGAAAEAAHAAMLRTGCPPRVRGADTADGAFWGEADTDSDAASRMAAVVRAAREGDSLSVSLLASVEAAQLQAAGEAPLTREQVTGVDGFLRAVRATAVRGVGTGVSIAQGADPTAVQLQLAADAQAASIAPVPSGQQGVFDGHIVRV